MSMDYTGMSMYGMSFVERADELIEKYCKKIGREVEVDEEDLYDIINDLLSECDLDWHAPFGDDVIYIGREWSEIKDDETGAEFRARVIADLEKVFEDMDIVIDCDTHIDYWSF